MSSEKKKSTDGARTILGIELPEKREKTVKKQKSDSHLSPKEKGRIAQETQHDSKKIIAAFGLLVFLVVVLFIGCNMGTPGKKMEEGPGIAKPTKPDAAAADGD